MEKNEPDGAHRQRQTSTRCRVGPLRFPWARLATDALHYYNDGTQRVTLILWKIVLLEGNKIIELYT